MFIGWNLCAVFEGVKNAGIFIVDFANQPNDAFDFGGSQNG
jgi:hypothetical protein